MKPTLKRSNAPIFWALFGAGGMLSALLGPMLVFITGIAVPLGVAAAAGYHELPAHACLCPELDRQGLHLRDHRALPVARRAPHLHSLHDVGIHAGTGAKLLCYGWPCWGR
jgi:fumarate reductase subunit D